MSGCIRTWRSWGSDHTVILLTVNQPCHSPNQSSVNTRSVCYSDTVWSWHKTPLQLGWKGVLAFGSQEIPQSDAAQQTSHEISWEGGYLCSDKKQQRTGQNKDLYRISWDAGAGGGEGRQGLKGSCGLILGQTRGLVGFSFSCRAKTGHAQALSWELPLPGACYQPLGKSGGRSWPPELRWGWEGRRLAIVCLSGFTKFTKGVSALSLPLGLARLILLNCLHPRCQENPFSECPLPIPGGGWGKKT